MITLFFGNMNLLVATNNPIGKKNKIDKTTTWCPLAPETITQKTRIKKNEMLIIENNHNQSFCVLFFALIRVKAFWSSLFPHLGQTVSTLSEISFSHSGHFYSFYLIVIL